MVARFAELPAGGGVWGVSETEERELEEREPVGMEMEESDADECDPDGVGVAYRREARKTEIFSSSCRLRARPFATGSGPSGLWIKSKAPACRACSVISAPARVSVLTTSTPGELSGGGPAGGLGRMGGRAAEAGLGVGGMRREAWSASAVLDCGPVWGAGGERGLPSPRERSVSSPVRPGMCRSSVMRSGGERRQKSSACSPL